MSHYKAPRPPLRLSPQLSPTGSVLCPRSEKGSDKADEWFPAFFLYSGLVYTVAPRSL